MWWYFISLSLVAFWEAEKKALQLNAASDQGLSAETCFAEKIYLELSLFV